MKTQWLGQLMNVTHVTTTISQYTEVGEDHSQFFHQGLLSANMD